jgi:hypothetical protein
MRGLRFPKIPLSEYIKVRKTDYELMKKMVERQDNYVKQIMDLSKELNKIKEELIIKEEQRRKLAGKIGGMKKYINRLKNE